MGARKGGHDGTSQRLLHRLYGSNVIIAVAVFNFRIIVSIMGSFIENRKVASTSFNELAVKMLHAIEVQFVLVEIGGMANLAKIEDHYIEGRSVMQQLLDAYGQGTQMVSSVAPPVPASPALPMPSDSASGQYLG